MFGWLSSFWWKKSTNDGPSQTDNIPDIPEEADESSETDAIDNEDGENSVTEDLTINNETTIKTGRITECNQNSYMIDNLYTFRSEFDLKVNTQISYQLIKTNGEITINDVQVLETYWDCSETVEKPTKLSRVSVHKVVKRNGRLLELTPELTIDLNSVRSEFVPIVGDWISLDAVCAIDETRTDLCGDILEIEKIKPLRASKTKGKITQWDKTRHFGKIDQHIYFDKDSLCCAYIPVVNDHVIAEIIESEQGLCSWRAIKLISDSYYEKRNRKLQIKTMEELTNNLQENHPNVVITENIMVTLTKLGDLKPFTIDIHNKTQQDLILFEIETPDTGNQCSIITEIRNVEILKNHQFTIKCECVAATMGGSKELLIFNFGDFRIKRWIKITVGIIQKRNSKFRQYQKDIIGPTADRELIRGQRVVQPARFISTRVPDFVVPPNLLQLIENTSRDTTLLKLELERLKPVLASQLTYTNYEEYFHTLIHLDEIHSLLSMRNYNQARTCFFKSSEYLVLKIDNLIDRRPTIAVGDCVVARDINDAKKPDYEGFIHKIIDNDIYIKFTQHFHDHYDGEDYAVKIVASRTTYKREHYAISLAVKNLGKNILFPSKVDKKPPQINFIINNDDIEEISVDQEINLKWHNNDLNQYQKEAVRNSLLGVCRPLPYIIFGPPGTGKSVTIVEIVLQILALIPDARILLATPSNSAADLLAYKLIDSGVIKPGDMVRFLAYTAASSVSQKLAPYSATANFEKPGTVTQKTTTTSDGMKIGCSSAALGRHIVTICTCSNAGALYLLGFAKGHFSHIIVDEAGQTSESSIMIPLSFLDVQKGQAILAGDPMQLGPVILSTLAAHYGLEESYLERVIRRFPYSKDISGFPKSFGYDPRLITKLVFNYRSLPVNLKLPSYLFYDDDLISMISETESKEARILQKLESMLPRTKNNKIASVIFHSVVGDDCQKDDSPSWLNPLEAARVFVYVNRLYSLGMSVADIGIITPYKAQAKLIHTLHRNAGFTPPKIGTVEEFQGQEFNVIIMSTVRSSERYYHRELLAKFGFVASPRRINVSITRAKALLIIVGNPHLLKHDKTWRAVIEYCCDKGGYIG